MTRILVIEDENSVRENIIELLGLEGFQTAGASNGYEGFFLASTEPFDLVLCDIMLPRMDGFEVLQRLRRDPRTVDLPLIFLTAKTQRESQREGMNLGAEDYITKPYTRVELLQSIHSRLERKKSLNLALISHMADHQRQNSYQLPLEFSGPLSIILNASGYLANPETNINPVDPKELGRQIHLTSLVLMEAVQKYLFMADLEAMPVEKRQTGKTMDAGKLFSEIFLDKSEKKYSGRMDIQEFNCLIHEADYFKFCEYLTDFISLTADTAHPVDIIGKVDRKEEKAILVLAYETPGLTIYPDRLNEPVERPSAVMRESQFIQRMADLLGIDMEITLRDPKMARIHLKIPLVP
jgi:two-component system, sensor histidine kinase and response regulator